MKTIDNEAFIKFVEYLNQADEQLHIDLVDEILSELVNERHDTDTDRVNGIIEAIEWRASVKITK